MSKCKICSRDLTDIDDPGKPEPIHNLLCLVWCRCRLQCRITLEAGEGLLGAKGPYCEACWERLETAKAIAERYDEDYG